MKTRARLRYLVVLAAMATEPVGASSAVRSLQIPSQVGDVVQGTLLLVVVGAVAVYRWRSSREDDRPPDEGEREPEDPPDRPEGTAPVEAPPA